MAGSDKKWVVFENGGQRIFGVLHQPVEEKGPFPAVVICHGFGGNKCGKHRLYVLVANQLAALGIAVLRFDFRGSGDSDGNFNEMELHSEVSDVIAAVNYLKKSGKIDPDRIAILGTSLGGAVAVLAAAQIPGIKALALWSPVYNASQWKEFWNEVKKTGGNELLDEEYVAFEGQLTNLAFVHQFFAMDLLKELKKIEHIPLIHFHGKKDLMVNEHHAQMYQSARKTASEESLFVVLENSDHDFNSVIEQQKLLIETSHWLAKKLYPQRVINEQ